MEPIASAVALLGLLGFSVSAWGWGRMALAVCRLEPASAVAYPTMLGLAVLAALGGWLNVFNLAYPPSLWMLLAGGWIFALHRVRVEGSSPWRRANGGVFIMHSGVIALVAVFLALTLLPSAAFNPNDDFQLYFPRPVRMLQTGSLGHNPFDPIGFDSVGTQAFLQAFTLLAFPLQFINAFDAVLCAVLCLALVAAIGKSLRLDAPVILAALAAVALVAPQQVNISPVYATAAFSLALVPAAMTLLEQQQLARANLMWRATVPLGALVAALVGLKITTLSFLVPAAFLFLGAIARAQGWRRAAMSAGGIAASASFFLLPWIALHRENYAHWLGSGSRGEGFGVAGSAAAFLAGGRLRWGGSVMDYNAAAALALAAALLGGIHWLRQHKVRPDQPDRHRVVPLATLCGGAVAAYFLNAFPYDLDHAVRYSAPVLLAATAAGILLIGALLPRRAALAVAPALALAVAILFADTAAERLRNALGYRTALSYSGRELPQFAVLTGWGFDSEVREWVRKAQAPTQAGKPILALIACPSHLFFARNPVLTVSEFGLSTPWMDLPVDADASTLRGFLQRHGIRYVIWQVKAGVQTDEQLLARLGNPYPVDRLLARNLLSFRHALAELTRVSKLLHFDDGLIVIDVGERAQSL